MNVREVFNKMAKTYDVYRKADSSVLAVLFDEINELGNRSGKLSILDIGCGTGNYSIPLAEKLNASLTGIDISREMLREAKDKFPKGRWLLANVEKADFNDNSFDVVLMCFVIHHLKHREQVLRKVYRILKPFGKLLIVTDDRDQFYTSFYHQYIPRILEIDLKRFPKVDELGDVLEKIGFNVHVHKIRREERISTTEDIEELVRKGRARYFSTLTLISDSELERGLKKMKEALLNKLKYGPITRTKERTVVIAQKPS